MSITQMESLSLIVFEIFEKNGRMTFDLGSRSKVMAPNESPYMIFYMSTIQMESLSLIVFEIFEKTVHMTFDLGSRSKVMAPNESLYMISYMSTIQMGSLSIIVFAKTADFTFWVNFDLWRSNP